MRDVAAELSEPLLGHGDSGEEISAEGYQSAFSSESASHRESGNHGDRDFLDEAEQNNLEEHVETAENAAEPQVENETSSINVLWYLRKVLYQPILPECTGSAFLVHFRLAKFLVVTACGIYLTHVFVIKMQWEHRSSLRLFDILVYEGNAIALDCVVFFTVGRLHVKHGVDHLAWLLLVGISSVYTSYISTFPFLQHSVTLYEMHCLWTWQTWLFLFAFVLPIIAVIVLLHIQHAWKTRTLLLKISEMLITLFLCVIPPLLIGVDDDAQVLGRSFEFHHWYAGLLLGMHCNYDTWFSRAAMSWCWGQYMNGIAVWGRDPLLTCTYANYLGSRLHCHESLDDALWDQPDWRHCHGG